MPTTVDVADWIAPFDTVAVALGVTVLAVDTVGVAVWGATLATVDSAVVKGVVVGTAVKVAAGTFVGVLVGGAGVGEKTTGTDVAVGGTDVAVGGTDVAVGGTDVAVGGTDVAVGGTDVAVGDAEVTSGTTMTVALALISLAFPETVWVPRLADIGTVTDVRKFPVLSVFPLTLTSESKETLIEAFAGKPVAVTSIFRPSDVDEGLVAIDPDLEGSEALIKVGKPMPSTRAINVTDTTRFGRLAAMVERMPILQINRRGRAPLREEESNTCHYLSIFLATQGAFAVWLPLGL